jgi:NAD(P)-dependent dehydrogenase (short-subunit alcohol dehydrogenase family)
LSDAPPSGIICSVQQRGEIQALAASLRELLGRVTALVENAGSDIPRDDELELVAIERGLASTLRRVDRLNAKSDASRRRA